MIKCMFRLCKLCNICMQWCRNLFWPTLRKIVLLTKKTFWKWKIICKMFEIAKIIYSNSERKEQFCETEYVGTNNWGVETCRTRLEKVDFLLYASNAFFVHVLIGGHSTTTVTEFCHFLTPPPHLVHVVIECPLIDFIAHWCIWNNFVW